jgi:protein TonB
MAKLQAVLIFVLFLSCINPVSASEDFTRPILIEKSDLPELPRILNKNNGKGIALIKVNVDEKGRTSDVALIRSTGLAPLDEFIVGWVKEWKFLPKIMNNKTVNGFTMISMRYDLAENRFEAPPVNDLTMTLPAPYQVLFTSETDREESSETKNLDGTIKPVNPIAISKIPPDIQNRNIAVGTAIIMDIDKSGHVIHIERPLAISDDSVWLWIEKELKKVQWLLPDNRPGVKIKIPMILETGLCKAEFGDAQLLSD